MIRVTPVKGPNINPISPDTLNRTPTTVGTTPSDAIIGITIGAIMALPPPRVPSIPQISTELTIRAIFALF